MKQRKQTMIFVKSNPEQSPQQVERSISELISGIVHALPQVALAQVPRHCARSRALEFRAAFAANRKH